MQKYYIIDELFESINISKDRNKKLEWRYQGREQMHLEGRVCNIEGDKRKIMLCGPWEEDIVKHFYNEPEKTYEFLVEYFEGIRIALLQCTEFYIPKETEKILVKQYL